MFQSPVTHNQSPGTFHNSRTASHDTAAMPPPAVPPQSSSLNFLHNKQCASSSKCGKEVSDSAFGNCAGSSNDYGGSSNAKTTIDNKTSKNDNNNSNRYQPGIKEGQHHSIVSNPRIIDSPTKIIAGSPTLIVCGTDDKPKLRVGARRFVGSTNRNSGPSNSLQQELYRLLNHDDDREDGGDPQPSHQGTATSTIICGEAALQICTVGLTGLS